VICDDRRDLRQRIQDPRTGLAVYLRDVRDGRVGRQRGVDPRRVGRLLFAVRQYDRLAAQIAQNPHDTLAVAAIVRDEHLAALRNERAERCFDGECSAALQWTQTWLSCALMMATRSRHTVAVSSLNAPSQDPQSESIADFVQPRSSMGRASVVSGRSWGPQVFETAALQRPRALEDGVSSRTEMRVHTLQIAQNVQIQRVGLDRFRSPSASVPGTALQLRIPSRVAEFLPRSVDEQCSCRPT